MMMRCFVRMLLVAIGLLFSGPAFAQILPFEVRAGAVVSGVNDPGAGLFDPARLQNANVELLYGLPDAGLVAMPVELRPHIGGTMSFSGQEHIVYAGLSLTVRAPLLPVWGEASAGAGWQSGDVSNPASRFGCSAVARAAGTVGLDVLPGASVMATLSHLTDFGACNGTDTGRTDVGLRVGIRF